MAFVSFCTVLSSTRRVINSHSWLFLSLSLLFLLPLSISFLISPTLSISFLTLSLFLLVFLISLLAVGTITYSAAKSIHGCHVSISDSVKSLSLSFFPLLATSLTALPPLVFGVVMFFVIMGFDCGSNLFFACLRIALSFLVLCVTMQLQVCWSLTFVVVVVESKWGFEPLRRSNYLIKEMRSTAFALLFLFNFVIGFNIWGISIPTYISYANLWEHLRSILSVMPGSIFVTIFMLYYCVLTTVLYMYCKAQHGELPLEIAKEFVGEYVNLPVDDVEPPRVVYVAEP